MGRKILSVDLEYPRSKHTPYDTIDVNLVDVRASDGIRIKYDFERDGWVIYQPTTLSWEANDKECDPKYKEVAFCKSWQHNEDEDDYV